ncbi:MAG TPA: IS110 family transposase [Gemmatimonadaceae bacterium]
MSSEVLFIGLDVHKDSIMAAVLPAAGDGARQPERLPNEPQRVRRYFTALAKKAELRVCYEASSVGFVLHRQLRELGIGCAVIAPSLIPKRPGDKRKTDRRDAVELAHLYRAGELVEIRIPSELEEQTRDLVRCREILQREVIRSRHYLSAFLLRRGLIYRQGTAWKPAHLAWIRRLLVAEGLVGDDALVVQEFLALLEYKLARRDALDREIEVRALHPLYADAVNRLRCFRGVSTQAAMVLATEVGDWRRFGSPRELMAYLGLVPSEHSSGPRTRRGGITKAGNSRCRHVLVQAAWACRRRPAIGLELRERQHAQSALVIAHAWKAQQRLYKRYHRLVQRRSPHIAAIAVARELVGFLWAAMVDPTPSPRPPTPVAPVTPAPVTAGGTARVRRGRRAKSRRE